MKLWEKIQSLIHYGKVQCDICGEWGISNPNYEGCDGKAFVHYRGSVLGVHTFVHPEHMIRSHFAKAKRKQAEDDRVAHFTNFSMTGYRNTPTIKTSELKQPKPNSSIKLGGARVFLEEDE